MKKWTNSNINIGDIVDMGNLGSINNIRTTTAYHQFMFSRNGRNTYDGFSRKDQERWSRCWEFWDMYDCDGGGVYRG